MTWNPDQYHRFREQRFVPFDDLLPLIRKQPGMRAIDMGCGTSELTRKPADVLPDSVVIGIGSSTSMLQNPISDFINQAVFC